MSVHSANAGRGWIDDKPTHDKAFDYQPVGVTARCVPPIPDATGQIRCVDQQGPLFEVVPRPAPMLALRDLVPWRRSSVGQAESVLHRLDYLCCESC